MNWQVDYHKLMEQTAQIQQQKREKEQQRSQAVENFYASTVIPVLQEFRNELERYGRIVQIIQKGAEEKKKVDLCVIYQEKKEFDFQLRLEVDTHSFSTLYPCYSSSYPEEHFPDERTIYFMTKNEQKKTIAEISAEEILEHVYRRYREKLCIDLNVTKCIISDGPLNIDDFSC